MPIMGKLVCCGYNMIRYDLSMLKGPHSSPLFYITCSSFSFLTNLLLWTANRSKLMICLLILSERSSSSFLKFTLNGYTTMWSSLLACVCNVICLSNYPRLLVSLHSTTTVPPSYFTYLKLILEAEWQYNDFSNLHLTINWISMSDVLNFWSGFLLVMGVRAGARGRMMFLPFCIQISTLYVLTIK